MLRFSKDWSGSCNYYFGYVNLERVTGLMKKKELRIHSLISFQAKANPDSIAITAPGRLPLTYNRLQSHMEEVGERLHEFGLGKNDRIALVLSNGPEAATAFLAVASVATCAPLNPGYRKNEFVFYLSDLNAKALIVQEGMEGSAEVAARVLGTRVIRLSPASTDEAGIFTLSGDRVFPPASPCFSQPEDIAVVIHTSGTVARPKIVPLTQENICSSVLNLQAILEVTESDRCINVMPLFHLHGLLDSVLMSAVTGGCVVCTPGFDASRFFDWIKEFRPTWYTAVPTIHQAILENTEMNREVISQCPMRFLRSTSSALPPRIMAELEAVFQVPVIEAYGMTENTRIASNPMPPRARKAGSVGVVFGPDVAIMDEAGGNLLEPGEIGEIVVRGGNLMQGYENNPEANKSDFVDGWFRTGDQGYFDSDEYLFLTGRLKEIINRGGRKVSPREVDDVLMDHPMVSQAVTFSVSHPTLGEDVVAAVVPRGYVSATEKEIREFAFARLADYKVPSRVLFLEEIPKGPTGKLQRIGLAEKLSSALRPDFVAPRTQGEEILAGIWREVLGTERIGVQDNFFLLGGDSLKATRVVSRIRDLFQVELPLQGIFQSPSIEDLLMMMEECRSEAASSGSTAKILAEVEDLSEEEAEKTLSMKTPRDSITE
jgi:acyl-CoA synthetase (AMP-forming)/AMP-acid ligase II/acyl carrier protein